MSEENKPRIYAFCDAGCKWRAAHYSDLEGAAAMLPISADENGNYVVDVGDYCRFDIGVDPVSVLCKIGVGGREWQADITSNDFYGEFRGDYYYGAEIGLLRVSRSHQRYQQPPYVALSVEVELAGHEYYDVTAQVGVEPTASPCKRWHFEIAKVYTDDLTDEELSILLYDPLWCKLFVSAGDENHPITRAHKLNKNATLEIKTEGGITVTHDGAGNVTLN